MCFPRQQAGKDSVYLQFKVRSRAGCDSTQETGSQSPGLQPGRSVRLPPPFYDGLFLCSDEILDSETWENEHSKRRSPPKTCLWRGSYNVSCRPWTIVLWRHTGLQTFGNVVLTFTLGFSVEAKQFSTCVLYKWASSRYLSLLDFFLICVYVFMYMHLHVYVYVRV